MNGRIEIVKFPLENGACANAIDECGDTLLHLIVSYYKPKTKIIKILLAPFVAVKLLITERFMFE